MKIMLRLAVLAFVLSVSVPVFAGGDGFFASVDLLAQKPVGVERDYVITDPVDDLRVAGDVQSVDTSGHLVPRVTLGWRWSLGSDSWGAIGASYWHFDRTGSSSRESGGGVLWDVLSPPNSSLAGMTGYLGTARADLAIEAKVVDLTYSRDVLAGPEGRVRLELGLRHIVYTSTLAVAYADSTRETDVTRSSDLSATGARVGVLGWVPLGRTFGLELEGGFAAMRGHVVARSRAASAESFPDLDVAHRVDRTVDTMDVALRLRADLGHGFAARLGVEWTRWSGAVDDLSFVDDVNAAAFVSQTTDAQFQAVTLGAAYRW